MARHRITIESATITATEVYDSAFDTSGGNIVNFVNWQRKLKWTREAGTMYHRYMVDGSLLFAGLGYTLIYGVLDECEVINVLIEKYDGAAWANEWEGEFTRFDCSVDEGRCLITVKPRIALFGDAYECTLRRWDRPTAIIGVTPTVTVRGSTAEIYEVNPTYCYQLVSSPTQPPISSYCTVPSGWCLRSQSSTENGTGSGQWVVQQTYHRETAIGTGVTPPPIGDPGDWTLLTGVVWWRCPETDNVAIGKFETGRYFNEVFEYITSTAALDCDITVRSHFFGINDTHTAPPSNTAYAFATNNLQALTMHQKSDIKRPFATPATEKAWQVKLRDFLADLRILFNVYFQIVPDGSGGYDMIVEHVTYFEAQAGPDHTTKPMTLRYEYDVDVPARELFKFMDEECSAEFAGYPITYDCGNGDVTNQCFVFSTDVEYIKDPANQNVIQDTGFVLMATQDPPPNGPATSERVLITGNSPLSWPTLHTYLHKDYRKFGEGTMNNTATTFNSVEPLKKQPPYTVGVCPDETFDPTVYYTTNLGDGQVVEAVYNIERDNVALTLKY